ncbi:hypothetical protein HOY82DRAFT_598368 [Tuber indicum]|nr:hypothetical protein HOY82DRAFT_598368 [Tuber indicum]
MAEQEVLYNSEEGEAEFARLEEHIETARADREESEIEEADNEDAGLYNQVACYPSEFNVKGSVLEYFQLFFDNSVFQQLTENTNLYTSFKGAGNSGSRP